MALEPRGELGEGFLEVPRSFALNLYQLYHNENKGKKLPTGKVTMAEIKRTCKHDDTFTAELFEQKCG